VKLDATLCFVCDDNNMKRLMIKNKDDKDDINKNQIKFNNHDKNRDDDGDGDDDYADVWDSGDVGGFECKQVEYIELKC